MQKQQTSSVTPWILLVLLAVVGALAALLGTRDAPASLDRVALESYIHNTAGASSYIDIFAGFGQGGAFVQSYTYNAPDRVSVLFQEQGRKQYEILIGADTYRSAVMGVGAPETSARYVRLSGRIPIDTVEPLQQLVTLLPQFKTVTRHGDRFDVTMTSQQTRGVAFSVYVSGDYIARLTEPNGYVLQILKVGSAGTVTAPPAARILG